MLDPTGTLLPGIPFCPPEGDAGTGMAATNTVAKRTGNVSAGTSIFAMVVLEEVTKMALLTRQVDPSAIPAPQYLQDKHYLRKHGPNAYYGQKK